MMITNLGVLPNLQGDLKAKACWVAKRMFADREVVFYVDDGKGIGIGFADFEYTGEVEDDDSIDDGCRIGVHEDGVWFDDEVLPPECTRYMSWVKVKLWAIYNSLSFR